jgi:hypothetical protein
MPEPQEIRLDVHQLECIIAAILTGASVGEEAQSVVRRYAEIYTQLQTVGCVVVPESPS